jgi:hypothetical protein
MRPSTRTRALFTVLACFAALIVLSLAWAATALAADPGNPLWTRLYGNAGNQRWEHVAACPNGDLLVAGRTDQGTQHLLVGRYSPGGAKRWVKVIDAAATGDDTPMELLSDGAGNAVVLAGRALSGGSQTLVCKLSAKGRVLWKKVLDGGAGGYNSPRDLALDAAGDAWVTGGWTTAGPVQGSCTMRLRARDGKVIAQRLLSGTHTLDLGLSLTVDGTGNVYVTGSGDRGDGTNETVTVKLRPNGTVVWTAEAPAAGAYRSAGNEIALAGSRLYVVSAVGPSGPSNTIFAFKYSTAGVLQWSDELNVPADVMDTVRAATTDRHGNLFVCGDSGPAGPMDWGFVARWTPTKARWLWAKPDTDTAMSSADGVVADQAGGCWLAGSYTIANHTAYSMGCVWSARISKSGGTRWEQLQAGVGVDLYGYDLARCSGGLAIPGLVVTGGATADNARLTVIRP